MATLEAENGAQGNVVRFRGIRHSMRSKRLSLEQASKSTLHNTSKALEPPRQPDAQDRPASRVLRGVENSS